MVKRIYNLKFWSAQLNITFDEILKSNLLCNDWSIETKL